MMDDVKVNKTGTNLGKESANRTATAVIVILTILVSGLPLSYSGSFPTNWTGHVANAARLPSHSPFHLTDRTLPLLTQIRFPTSSSGGSITRVALLPQPAIRAANSVPVAPILASPLVSSNPFNAMTAAAATVSNPLVSVAANPIVPLLQGTTNNGFVSYLCPGSTLQTATTPSPSLLNFGAATPAYNSVLPIVGGTPSIPLSGTFTLYNPLLTGGAAPIVTGQINSGTLSGNSFTLQGTLASTGISGGGALCNSSTASPFFPFAFNTFTISGTCGANFPLAFAIDRSVLGAFNARVVCNSF